MTGNGIDLEADYGIDTLEVGKFLLIASATLLVLSIHSFFVMHGALKDVRDSRRTLDRASALMDSDSFQRSVSGLKDIGALTSGNSISAVIDALDSAKRAINETRAAEERLEQGTELYQWLALIGLLGSVAGVVVILM